MEAEKSTFENTFYKASSETGELAFTSSHSVGETGVDSTTMGSCGCGVSKSSPTGLALSGTPKNVKRFAPTTKQIL